MVNIREERRRREWSQEFLAEKIGRTQQTILKWETNPDAFMKAPLGDVIAIAEAFDMTLSEFFS